MPSDDLQTSIVTKLGQSLSALDRLSSRMEKVEKSVKKVNKSSKNAYAQWQRQWGNARQDTTKAGRGVADLSQALGRMGGPTGEIAAKIGGGAGMAPALARLSAAAGIAGLGIRVLTSVTDMRVRKVQQAIEAERAYAKAVRDSQRETEAAAQAGASDEQVIRQLVARGGQGAVREADRIAATGVDAGQARRGVLAAQDIADPYRRRQAIATAQRLSRTGLIGFDEALQQISGDRGLQARLSSLSGQDRVGAELVRRATGQRTSPEQVREMVERVEADPYLQAVDTTRRVQAATDREQRARVTSGALEGAARAELGRTRDPLAAMESELFRLRSEELATLRRLADAQGSLAAVVADLGMLIGGEGSKEQQRRRLQRVPLRGD